MPSASKQHHAQDLLTDKVVLARVIRPHGLKGAVRVKSFTENPLDFAKYSLTDPRGKEYRVTSFSQQSDSDFFNVFFEDVNSRTDAEKLHGTDLMIDKKDLPPVPEDTFYYADLIGLKAVLSNNLTLVAGTVCAVHNFGAGDLLEIQNAQDTEKDSWMIPFSSEQIIKIDLTEKTLVFAELS
jgi:16S rRNA processing protein RimM